jgi:hypothetical protein
MRKVKCVLLILVFLFLSLANPASARTDQSVPGLTLDQIKAIIDTASGELALTHIRQLTLHHRWFVSDGYHEAALYVQSRAKAYGLSGVGIETFPADGKIFYSTDKSYPKWTVRSARLRLVAPIQKHLVSWAENPITLATYSRTANVTAELVDVGKGVKPLDYEGKDVKGKLVLASSPQGEGRIELVHRLAVLERGAAGVISYRGYNPDAFPELITWDHIFTHKLSGKQSTFGFCIPKRMGWEFQRLLREGERVVLHAEVDADITAGEYEIVRARIPGSDLADQEIWFTAHLDHHLPAANDNASGSAAILETARTLKALIDSGFLPAPRRTIRFFWVPEICGTYAYIVKHLEEARRAVAVINMDMVGEHQTKCGSLYNITKTPDSMPSYFNDILAFNLEFLKAHGYRPGKELVDPFLVVSLTGSRELWNARVTPYSGGSDHIVFLGGVLNVPATQFGNWPDHYYHSSGDTPDKSDSTTLKRSVVLGTMVAASIANMDTQAGLKLISQIYPRSLSRLGGANERARNILRQSDLTGKDFKEALNTIHWAGKREEQALKSLSLLLPNDQRISEAIQKNAENFRGFVESSKQNIKDAYREFCKSRGKKPEAARLSEEEKAAQKLIPIRNSAYPGPISGDYLEEKVEDRSSLNFPFSGLHFFEIAAFIDGRKSVLDIRNAVSAECGPVELADVLTYLKLLEKIDLVSFK